MTRRSLWSGCLLLTVILTWLPAALGAVGSVDWTLETVDGHTVTFSDETARGPVLVAFWATWCRPCVKELPHLDALAERFAGRVSFLAVNADNSKSVAKVPGTLRALGVEHLTVPMDTGGTLQQLLQTGGVMPFTVLYDAAGREAYRHIGYKEGDELELARQIDRLLDAPDAPPAAADSGPLAGGVVTATDQFEYSYSTDTGAEIFDNWLDVSYRFGDFRTGILLRSQAPGEEGRRGNEIVHRFFEFSHEDLQVRAGHFYGIFGRGLIFNAFEDRVVRIDTRLDGITATMRRDQWTATVFSGTPAGKPDDPEGSDIDVRGMDLNWTPLSSVRLGASGLTWRPDDFVDPDDRSVHRDGAGTVRISGNLDFGDAYFEHGWKADPYLAPDHPDAGRGRALYANVNLYTGPWSLSWEKSDYQRFEVVRDSDGINPLNRPPSLTGDFTWTLPNRAPHLLDVNDERGHNLDLGYAGEGWGLQGSAARIKRHDGSLYYESIFGTFQVERVGPVRASGGFGYQESEGLRQTAVGELVWRSGEQTSWTLQAEHQHVRLGGGEGFDLGAYDQQWFKLEFETAPRWALAALFETNNKVDAQRPATEREGPFPAGQITYSLKRGGTLSLWLGKRQAGYLCSGGLCKIEPAFEGIEFTGILRY